MHASTQLQVGLIPVSYVTSKFGTYDIYQERINEMIKPLIQYRVVAGVAVHLDEVEIEQATHEPKGQP